MSKHPACHLDELQLNAGILLGGETIQGGELIRGPGPSRPPPRSLGRGGCGNLRRPGTSSWPNCLNQPLAPTNIERTGSLCREGGEGLNIDK